MRKLLTIAAGLLAAAAVTWFAHPPARQWPILSHVGSLFASTDGAMSPDARANTGSAEQKGRSARGPAVPVVAATAVAADMPVTLSAPGTVEAFATVEVKPRVDGQISEVAFTEGQEVKAGDVLFRLDDRLIRAQMRQAEANIARDRAALTDAEGILRRRETLVTKNIVTEQATETQRSAVEALRAAIVAGEAQLEGWRTQLDYLTIPAPISGRTGAVKTKIGANVRMADTAPLVTINQTRPIAVAFSVPQADLVNLRRALAANSEATIRVGGEVPIATTGHIMFIDNQVDRTTGTLMGKAHVPNANEVLWPGQAVDVEVVVERRPGFVSVPASGVLPSQQGMLAWVIGADGTVKPRPVALARVIAGTAYLSDGLDAGERVVIDGQLRLAPGTAVTVRAPAGANPAGANDGATPEPSGASPAKNDKSNAAPESPARGPAPAARDTPKPPPGPERGRT